MYYYRSLNLEIHGIDSDIILTLTRAQNRAGFPEFIHFRLPYIHSL